MGVTKTPRSLRSVAVRKSFGSNLDGATGKTVSAVASLIAVASVSTGAQAQQSTLPPVNVDAPKERPRSTAAKPTPEQVRARNALRRAAQRQQAATAPVANPTPGAPDRNPYADPAAPYKVDHMQASGKFPEKLVDTPRSVTVLSKEVLEDKGATSLKQAILSTAGVTLGTGEGGNAFGDRFFIRGFDARNDIFIDGMRDAGVSVRENFFTEQVEILRGPASSFAGRGTAGGAINIVTKQATTEKSFYNMDTTFGTDQTKRVTLDVNQVVDPDIRNSRRRPVPGCQCRGPRQGHRQPRWRIRGHHLEADRRDQDHQQLHPHRIDRYAGFRRAVLSAEHATSTAGGPFPDFGVNRNNFYGFVNRDFFGPVRTSARSTPRSRSRPI